jgi:hypothetical protein
LTQWTAGLEPTPAYRDHVYAGGRHLGNVDRSTRVPAYGARWHWDGAQHDYNAPLVT